MGAFLTYTVLRLAVFAAALGVFWLLGARGLLLVVLAAFASFAVSYVLLRRPREALSRRIAERVDPSRPRKQGRLDRRLAQDAQAEDDAADRTRPPSAS